MKIKFIILALLALLASRGVYAYDFYVDGIYYNINGSNATVTSGTISYSGDVIIPSTVTYQDVTYDVTSIGDHAFSGGVVRVTIPESVTSIEDYAFSNNTSLNKVIGGSGVTSIGNYAFNECTNLSDITIPEGLTSINVGTFYNCPKLKSITIPNGVTSIGSYAFYCCLSLTSIDIPESVTSIGGGAFRDCTRLTSVTIPESLTDIGDGAFEGCTSLPTEGSLRYADTYLVEATSKSWIDTYTIKSGTRFIGSHAFDGCSRITSIDIPESVTSIGGSAFRACAQLASITIPNSVTSIVGSAFNGCSRLTSVTLNSNALLSKDYTTSSNLGTIFGSQVKNYIIGDDVTSIGQNAFYNCSSLTSVTIPETVTSIGQNAFYGCSSLTKAEFASIESLCGISFNTNYANPLLYAHHLYVDGIEVKDLVIPESVTSIRFATFWGCSGLTSVTIPNGVTSIGQSAFLSCSGLTSVTISNSVTSIGPWAFQYCSGLTSITIPESVTSIGDAAFNGCTSLPVIDNVRYADTYLIEAVDKTQSSYTIKSGTRYIGKVAFQNCSYLTSITIPESVTIIDDNAFEGCTSLPVIDNVRYADTYLIEAVDKTLSTYNIKSGTRFIGNGAFENCCLTSITIPNSVTSISGSAFNSCSGLTSVTLNSNIIVSTDYFTIWNLRAIFGSQVTEYIIGDDVTSIGRLAFYNCTNLSSVTIGCSVTSIGNEAFYGCSGLTSITIPETVTSIGKNTFYGCSSLTKAEFASVESLCNITFSNAYGNPLSFAHHLYIDGQEVKDLVIPESVTSIRFATFFGCSGLTSVTIPNSVTSINLSAFHSCSGLTSATLGNSVNSIGNYAFYNCSNLSSINIPESVTSIGDAAFYGCTSLPVIDNIRYADIYLIEAVDKTQSSYTIKSGTRYIGKVAFQNCSYLTSITIPESVTIIDDNAFEGCTGLTSFEIPNSVTSICNNAFSNCTGLTSISIPESVTSIGDNAFSGCSSLASVNALAETPSSIQSTTIPSTIAKIRVPETSVSAYKAATNWSAFSAKIIALGGEDNSITVEEIEENKAAGGSANQTYIVTDAAADDVKAANNVIVHSGDNYTCAHLVLNDGEPFETMASEFTATAATYTRSVSVGNTSGTICVPYAFAKEDGVKYYTVDNTRSDDATIYLNEISEDIIPAATPVIYIKDGGKTTMTFSGSNAVAKKAAGTGSGTFELRGTFEKMTITGDELTKSYALSGGKFLCSTTKLTINPFRAYLYNTGAVAGARLNLSVEDDDEPTGITSENVALMSGDAEIEGYYTLDGKRVGSLQKGVVTVIRYANGKSVKVFAQ